MTFVGRVTSTFPVWDSVFIYSVLKNQHFETKYFKYRNSKFHFFISLKEVKYLHLHVINCLPFRQVVFMCTFFIQRQNIQNKNQRLYLSGLYPLQR